MISLRVTPENKGKLKLAQCGEQRLAPFRKGRVFLLGDAAHIHSPAGGQGMNTGIGDAINLAWKLKAVIAGQASPALLDTYDIERRAFARKLVASTDRGFTLATAEGWVPNFIRTRVVPLVGPMLFRFKASRNYLFSAVSQISVAYHDSPISEGRAGAIKGGDRLPWANMPGDDNFETLRQIDWQVHVYGTPSAELAHCCRGLGLALNTFAWQEGYAQQGLIQNAMYLLRPDTYVALASSQQNPKMLMRYFEQHALSLKQLPNSAVGVGFL